jgi:alpha/beta superfamily hydrolase
MRPVTAYGGDENRSWFDYLTDREGEGEDAVDTASVRAARSTIQRLVWREHAAAPPNVPIMLGGLSQGGCLALDVASRDASLAAVVTGVAHRLHLSLTRPLLCPWYALIASDDDVFPFCWAAPAPQDCAHVTVAEGADHYLSKGELAPFVVQAVRSVMGTGVAVTTTAEQGQVPSGP